MTRQLFALTTILLFSLHYGYGQKPLFESRELDKAYQKTTRSRVGIPGECYWQNHSTYTISARFLPNESKVTGKLSVVYYNESPDTLKSIVFKLMQNVYKKGANRQMPVDEMLLHDGVIVKNIRCGGNEKPAEMNSLSATVVNVSLPDELLPGSNVTIKLDFETPIPKKSGFRSGTIDSSSFFVAYWFPQIAVYDDIFGWDKEQYVGIPETYNDFSGYEVQLTLPSEYTVWATGDVTNESEVYSKAVLERIRKSKKSETAVSILTEKDFKKPDGNELTWKFNAVQVPDFAWGASDHYVWEGQAAQNPGPENLCWVQSAYPSGAAYFDMVSGVAKTSVELFSREFPGITYPYFKHITFRGTDGGGMEFPMIANNDVAYDSINTILVTAHELAHNYYPFMMGVNERKFGWWDETMTTLMECYVNEKAYPDQKIHGFFDRNVSFNFLSPAHSMVPLITETSNIMKEYPSITNFYVKGPAAMDILQNLIGKDNFTSYNKSFMEVWRGKHPTPWDFFYYFNEKSGEDMNWFWNSWFYSFGYADLTLADVTQTDQYVTLTIKNKGGFPVPFTIRAKCQDGGQIEENVNIRAWKSDTNDLIYRILTNKKIALVTLDFAGSYDADPANNTFSIE